MIDTNEASAGMEPLETEKKENFIQRFMSAAGEFHEALFRRWIPIVDSVSLDWVEDADRAMLEAAPIRTRILLYTVTIVVFALIIWSAFAEIDQVARGDGKVIPSQKIQIIQSQDGGLLTDILVTEGELVEMNQLLVRLDATRFSSTLRENRVQYLGLQAKATRLKAIADDKPFTPDKELSDSIPAVLAQEFRLYQSSIKEYEAEQGGARQRLTQREEELGEARAFRDQSKRAFYLASRELSLTKPLVDSGAVSEVEMLRLEREVSSLRGDLAQAESQVKGAGAGIREAQRNVEEVGLQFKNNIGEELSKVTAEIERLKATSFGLSDRVKQTAIRSPVRGTIKRVFFNTIGGVVLPGDEVVEVVPLDDTLLLEARVNPKDIAHLFPGQEALVKFTAYDFVVHGGLKATVEHIGADTVMDEDGNPYYTVKVRTIKFSLGEDKPIIPGMVAEVDILTGKKTVLAYLLKPVLRAKQYALSER
jgi:adhesin transport system membrane fusion protein